MDTTGKLTAMRRGLHIRYIDLSDPRFVITLLHSDPHYHYTVVAIIAGKIQFVNSNALYEADAYQICLLPTNCVIKPETGTPAKFWLLRLGQEYIEGITYNANKKAIKLLDSGQSCLAVDNETFRIIKKLLLLLYKFQDKETGNAELICILTVNLLLSCIGEINAPGPASITGIASRKERVAFEFLRLIAQHSKQHHDVAYYAGCLCMTQGNLTKIVREVLSKPPKPLIEEVIMEAAKEQLDRSTIPVYLIADELNFKSSSAFINFFRGRTGVTPSEYRNRKTR